MDKQSSLGCDLRSLLECASVDFLPQAFLCLLGREPDQLGILSYAQRLHKHRNRLLCLVELRVSPEGRKHAGEFVCPDLDLAVRRYLRVRNLPVGPLRWVLMPVISATVPNEQGFDWERWVNDYIAQQLDSLAREAVSREVQNTAAHPSSSEVVMRIDQLEQRVTKTAAVLEQSFAALQSQEVPTHAKEVLEKAQAVLQYEAPEPALVSWEARQHLHVLVRSVR